MRALSQRSVWPQYQHVCHCNNKELQRWLSNSAATPKACAVDYLPCPPMHPATSLPPPTHTHTHKRTHTPPTAPSSLRACSPPATPRGCTWRSHATAWSPCWRRCAAARPQPRTTHAPPAAGPCTRRCAPLELQLKGAGAGGVTRIYSKVGPCMVLRLGRICGRAWINASAPPEASRSHEDEVDRRAGAPPTLGREVVRPPDGASGRWASH